MKIGDKVVCVDASDDPRGIPVPPIKGAVYEIAAIWGDLPNSKLGRLWTGVGFDLVGIDRLPDDYCYGAYRFRPVEYPGEAPVKRHAYELQDEDFHGSF